MIVKEILYLNKKSSMEKIIEVFIKGLVIAAETVEIFFLMKVENAISPSVSLGAMNIIKLDVGICGGY